MGLENVQHTEQASASSGSSVQKEHDLLPVAEPPHAHEEHGPLVDSHIPQEDAIPSHPDLLWSRIRHTCRQPFAEFFGVFILILFGDGVVAQVVLSNGEKGDYQSISWGWG